MAGAQFTPGKNLHIEIAPLCNPDWDVRTPRRWSRVPHRCNDTTGTKHDDHNSPSDGAPAFHCTGLLLQSWIPQGQSLSGLDAPRNEDPVPASLSNFNRAFLEMSAAPYVSDILPGLLEQSLCRNGKCIRHLSYDHCDVAGQPLLEPGVALFEHDFQHEVASDRPSAGE